MLLSKLDGSWNEGVLWRSIDERSILQSASHRKDSGRGDLLVSGFNCF